MTKTIINPSELAPPRGFNHGFLCSSGRVLFIAGQDASDGSGQIAVVGDIVQQYDQVLHNIAAVVTAAGGTMQDVVKLNIFVKSRDRYRAQLKALGDVHRRHFGRHYPALALLEVSGFFQEAALIELEGFAFIDGED